MTSDPIDKLVLPALAGMEGWEGVATYLRLFKAAAVVHAPSFFTGAYGESFRRHVGNPYWVIQSLVSNAVKEGEGSRDLGELADACVNTAVSKELAVHVEDEARHCRMYLQIIDIVFPDALSSQAREAITETFPELGRPLRRMPEISEWKLLDYMIQINLGEVRTRIHQKLMEPVLEAYCPDENLSILRRVVEKLSSDEDRHIQYTANRIGILSKEFSAKRVGELFAQCLLNFCLYTDRELGAQRDGLFPDAPLVRDK